MRLSARLHHEKPSLYRHHLKIDEKKPADTVTKVLLEASQKDIPSLLTTYQSSLQGLSPHEIHARLQKHGFNDVVHEKRPIWPIRIIKTCTNPLILLLFILAGVSILTGDIRTATLITIMIILSVCIRFFQENQAYNAAENLEAMVKTTCTVLREGKEHEIDLSHVVPGDIVILNAGDILPADIRLIESKNLFVNQSILTGESIAVEKHASSPHDPSKNPIESQNLCFMGTNVESGSAKGLVVTTGSTTYFGSIAKSIVGQREVTSFDKGVDRFTWLMIGFMITMVPLVFLVNGFTKGNWWEALLFAISVAVGLTPEMLPAIVSVNLSKGSLVMAKKKVIVKRLNSIQNLGAMDILCTDKTGTLTHNKIVLVKNINIHGVTDEMVLHYAYLNSFYQTGFNNLMDDAVLKYASKHELAVMKKTFHKLDEIPFDFIRKRLSVVVKEPDGDKFLICKGAIEEVAKICSKYEIDGAHHELTDHDRTSLHKQTEDLSRDGFRVIAVAYRKLHDDKSRYTKHDESDLIFLGLMAFLDPPKESAATAIKNLQTFGVTVKVLTGDNELVTGTVCEQVGLTGTKILLGSEIEAFSDTELEAVVEETTIFAKLSPNHKKRIIQALQKRGHVVGFLGDGINDSPALRTADVGISVNTAVDIAKESADIILLEKSLLVLSEGVIEGRKVFGNITKYIKMGASSNFGNMFSMLGASLLLPFLPMQPLQLIANNLLYDLSQTTIPTDDVDEEYMVKPRKWEINDIGRFMVCIGPISSIFDYVTFGVMWFILGASHVPALFQTGWFVESILTQTLIIHVIRSRKIPLLQTHASKPLLLTTLLIMITAIYLTVSPFANTLGFVTLPNLYWPILFAILFLYVTLTQLVKTIYIWRFGYN